MQQDKNENISISIYIYMEMNTDIDIDIDTDHRTIDIDIDINTWRWDQKVVRMIDLEGNPQFRRMKIERQAEESVGFWQEQGTQRTRIL